jgi:hypothetical protein
LKKIQLNNVINKKVRPKITKISMGSDSVYGLYKAKVIPSAGQNIRPDNKSLIFLNFKIYPFNIIRNPYNLFLFKNNMRQISPIVRFNIPPLTPRITCRHEAQRNGGQSECAC